MKTASLFFAFLILSGSVQAQTGDRPRLRDLGLHIGVFKPGTLNAITDVRNVLVGQVTIRRADSVQTGVTAILPHGENLFRRKVPAAIVVGNGFGKLVGATQVQELGQIETPIVLTNTLNVWEAANGVVDYMLALPGNENVRSINPVVGETNDGFLNDIRGRHVRPSDVINAIRESRSGAVAEGSVGAGTGTVCFGWKGGIGTSSRVLPTSLGGFTVGALVQTNYGGILDLAGIPLGIELGRYAFKETVESEDGSCMIVLATDAPLDARQLQRVAKRATLALGRTGSSMSHGSGDYVIAFSNAVSSLPRPSSGNQAILDDEALSPLFQATVEATEEAIYNSLLKATDTRGYQGRSVGALPVDRVKEILKKYGKIR